MTIQQLREQVSRLLAFDGYSVVDIVCAAYLSTKIPGEILWVLLHGPSSTGKTELIRLFEAVPDVTFVNAISSRALASGLERRKGQRSLLEQLDGKTLAFDNFADILSKRSELKGDLYNQIRGLHDGRITKLFGGEIDRVAWTGRVGFIGSIRPDEIYEYHRSFDKLSELFLLVRMPVQSRKDTCTSRISEQENIRPEVRHALKEFVATLKVHEVELADTDQIESLATFVTRARTHISRDRQDRAIKSLPEPNAAYRLSLQLAQLAKALTLVHKKDTPDEEVYSIVRKVAIDQVPRLRLELLQHLQQSDEPLSLSALTRKIRLPQRSVKRHLEDLQILDLAVKHGFDWHLSDDYKELLRTREELIV